MPEKNPSNMDHADWQRKAQLAEDMLAAYAFTEAARSSLVGVTSLELAEALMSLSRLGPPKPSMLDLDLDVAPALVRSQASLLGEAKDLVERALVIFEREDAAAPEGALLRKAQQLRDILKQFE